MRLGRARATLQAQAPADILRGHVESGISSTALDIPATGRGPNYVFIRISQQHSPCNLYLSRLIPPCRHQDEGTVVLLAAGSAAGTLLPLRLRQATRMEDVGLRIYRV